MNENTEENHIVAQVTVEIIGWRSRILSAAQVLFGGEFRFIYDPTDVVAIGERPPDTTCILTATPEELMAQQG